MNKFLQYCLLCLCLVSGQLYGQQIQYLHPSTTDHTYAEGFVQTPDGGYLIAGAKNNNVFINKLDANGNLQWEQLVGDLVSSSYVGVKDIEPTADGNYVLSVTTAISAEDPRGVKLVKIDILGNVLSVQSYHDVNDPENWGFYSAEKLSTTSDDGFILPVNIKEVEGIDGLEFSFQRATVLRMDSEGNQLWEKRLPDGMTDELGLLYDFGLSSYFPEPLTLRYSDYSGEHTTTISSIYAIDSLMNAWDNHSNWVFNPADSTLTGGHARNHNYYDRFLIMDPSQQVNPSIFNANYDNVVRLDVLEAIETSSGNVLVVGKQNDEAYAAMLDNQGNTIWENTYEFSMVDNGASCAVETFDGNFVIGGYASLFNSYQHRGLLFKIDADGTVLWDVTTACEFWESEAFASVVEANDHSIVASGHEQDFNYVNANAENSEVFIAKYGPDGTEIWKQRDTESGDGIVVLAFVGEVELVNDSTYAVVGHKLESGGAGYWRAFLKTYDNLGNTVSNLIHGQVFNDSNNNCAYETEEESLNQWLIEITGNGQTIYTTSDIHGEYATLVDVGDYDIEFLPLNNYWQTCSATSVSFTEPFSSAQVDLGAQSAIDCPYLEVDVSTPFVRRCFDNTYTVNYCNDGTVVAEDAYIEITLDEAFSYVSSSMPLTSQEDQVLRFDVGDVAVAECGSFSFVVYVDCETTVLGQTHCVEAHIYPDTSCDPSLGNSYAQIDIDAACQGDSTVVFTLKNIGTQDMLDASEYVVIEDHVMYLEQSSSFDLNIGQEAVVAFPANGATYRMQAPQLPGTAFQSYVSTSIEGCGLNEDEAFSTGWVTVYSENDEEPYLSVDCQENIGAYDPNDKQSFPKGFEEDHLIKKNTEIEYKIRFQNTGTDTAFYVEIIDTLSKDLNVASIAPGASSHPYTWRLYDENVVKFMFHNIMLPDSFVNEAASNGFVKFKIQQQLDLPLETRIENHADIYFDFNAPVRTPTTFLTIGENFVEIMTNTNEPEFAQLAVSLAPNPVQDRAIVTIDGSDFKQGQFVLYDASGHLVQQQTFFSNKFELNIDRLPAGFYFYSIMLDGRRANSGKIIK